MITSKTVRVIGAAGDSLGIMSRRDAIASAYELGLDLVEINPTAHPPVARICDYKKFLYQEKQRAKEQKAKQVTVTVKEIQLMLNISDHDLDTKMRNATRFLLDGDKVRIVIKFRGRELSRPETGRQLADKVLSKLDAGYTVERHPVLDGRNMVMILAPKKPEKSNGKATEAVEVAEG